MKRRTHWHGAPRGTQYPRDDPTRPHGKVVHSPCESAISVQWTNKISLITKQRCGSSAVSCLKLPYVRKWGRERSTLKKHAGNRNQRRIDRTD